MPARRRPSGLHCLSLVLGLAVASWLAACDDDGGPGTLDGPVSERRAESEFADRLCYEWRACDCDEAAGVSLAGCETGMRFTWQGVTQDAVERGLTYDGDCMARRLNAMRERGCDAADAAQLYPGCGPETCLVYHGEVAEGGACDGGLSMSDCRQGLVCLGTCQKPCQGVNIGAGEACLDSDGSSLGLCAQGLLCDPESGLCRSLPVESETCLLGQCAEGLYCDVQGADDMTCRARVAQGGACTTDLQCASATCQDGACAALPERGEACLAQLVVQRCAVGLACIGEVCAEAPGRGETCVLPEQGVQLPCKEGLSCGATLCRIDGDAPGCAECADPDGNCVVYLCAEPPAAVCADSGGLLY